MNNLFLLSLCVITIVSCGDKKLTDQKTNSLLDKINKSTNDNDKYQIDNANYLQPQIGAIWDRSLVNYQSINLYLSSQRKLIRNTVKVVSEKRFSGLNKKVGTAFYIGKNKSNEFLFATSNNMIKDVIKCNNFYGSILSFNFPALNKSFSCHQIVYNNSSINLAIISIKVSQRNEKKYFNSLVPYSFYSNTSKTSLKKQKTISVITAGFGNYKNSNEHLTIIDNHCNLYPKYGIKKVSSSFFNKNASKYSVWSMLSDCNISYGDQGAPIVDLDHNKFQGMFWAYTPNKAEEMKNENYISDVLNNNILVWKYLNYYVPASEIVRILENYVAYYQRNHSRLKKSEIIDRMLKRMKKNRNL